MYLPRHLESRLLRLRERFPAVVLLGARQVGKSTLLAQVLGPDVPRFVFDPVHDVGNARQDPELFLRLNRAPLLLDEVHHVPELLAPLKRVIDERAGQCGLYFLTGSQQMAVLKGASDSLAGRAVLLDLHGMTAGELAGRGDTTPCLEAVLSAPDADSLYRVLKPRVQPPTQPNDLLRRIYRGGFPGCIDFDDDEMPDWFSSYVRTYVERDVRSMRDVSDPHDFTRFIRLLAALSAHELNASQLGREIGITHSTAGAWLSVLEQSFQVIRLDAWAGNLVKRVSGRPKLHLADTGLAAWLLSVSTPAALSSHPALGALFESSVVVELLRQSLALPTRPIFRHWRSAGGAEVDLLLERDGRFMPIEVKLASRPSRRDARGLLAFREANPQVRIGPGLVVHAGPDLDRLDENTLAVPFTALF